MGEESIQLEGRVTAAMNDTDSSRPRTAYLAGPMRGKPEFNFPEFRRVAAKLRQNGWWTIISPAEMDEEHGFDGTGELPKDFSLVDAIMRDLKAITEVDAVILLPGWSDSKGANAEKALADFLGKDVLTYDDFVLDSGYFLTPIEHPHPLGSITGTEVRITNEATGGQKGRKPVRFELLPWDQLEKVARLYNFGATKYADHNWRKGYAWSLSFGAMMRHASLFWQGESLDAETGEHHLTSVVFHALALMWFEDRFQDLDDRYQSVRQPESRCTGENRVHRVLAGEVRCTDCGQRMVA